MAFVTRVAEHCLKQEIAQSVNDEGWFQQPIAS